MQSQNLGYKIDGILYQIDRAFPDGPLSIQGSQNEIKGYERINRLS